MIPPCPERQVGAGVIPALDVRQIVYLKHAKVNVGVDPGVGIDFPKARRTPAVPPRPVCQEHRTVTCPLDKRFSSRATPKDLMVQATDHQ